MTEVAGLMSLYPSGSNSTMFTKCCGVAICSDQLRCPSCDSLVVGHDARSDHERGKVRWKIAYRHRKK